MKVGTLLLAATEFSWADRAVSAKQSRDASIAERQSKAL
jgi:hypothetical protein